MIYTVKQLADLAGVSNRTLHYYDEIALLKPSAVGDNGYRYYKEMKFMEIGSHYCRRGLIRQV